MATAPNPPAQDHPLAGGKAADFEWWRFFKAQADVIRALQQRTQIQSAAAYPTAADIPAGEFRVWNNTSTNVLRLYGNVGGTLKFVVMS